MLLMHGFDIRFQSSLRKLLPFLRHGTRRIPGRSSSSRRVRLCLCVCGVAFGLLVCLFDSLFVCSIVSLFGWFVWFVWFGLFGAVCATWGLIQGGKQPLVAARWDRN